jgi:type I restriction enzyme, S subunit
MEQLLTGRSRLAGSHLKWSSRLLRDQLTYERPDKYLATEGSYSEDAEIPVLTANKSFVLGYTDDHVGVYRNTPAIIFDDFTTDCKFVEFPFKVRSSAIKILKPKSTGVILRFVFGQMQMIHFPSSSHKRYYISEYQNLSTPLPERDEQAAISRVLVEADAEIAALERRRDKLQSIKQGMTQSLLAGRVRLIEPLKGTSNSTVSPGMKVRG